MFSEGLFEPPEVPPDNAEHAAQSPPRPLKPERIFKQYAYEALECYPKENKYINWARWRHQQANAMVSEGYPEDDETVLLLRGMGANWQATAEKQQRKAITLFAAAIGIGTREDGHAVCVDDPTRQAELDKRYKAFRNLYAGVANTKLRDKVRRGKADIIIPTYSNADRYFDRVLGEQEATEEIDEVLRRAIAQAIGFPETTLNDPDELVLAVNLIDAYDLMLQSSSARGVWVSRVLYSGNFKEKLFAEIEPKTNEPNTLPERQEGESVKTFIEKHHLSWAQMIRLSKSLFRLACGYTALWNEAKAGNEFVPNADILEQWMTEDWHAEWTSRNGYEADTAAARKEHKEWLKDSVKLYREVQRVRNQALKSAQKPARRGKKPRPGQIGMFEEA
jgi:hypothetical protein